MLVYMSVTRWGLPAAMAAGLSFACASQRDTGRVLTATGAAAVIIGAATATGGCSPEPTLNDRGGDIEPALCAGGGRNKALGTAIAAAGVGVAAVGYAIEKSASGPDRVRRPHTKSPPPPPPRLRRPAALVANPKQEAAPPLTESSEASPGPEPSEEQDPAFETEGNDEQADPRQGTPEQEPSSDKGSSSSEAERDGTVQGPAERGPTTPQPETERSLPPDR